MQPTCTVCHTSNCDRLRGEPDAHDCPGCDHPCCGFCRARRAFVYRDPKPRGHWRSQVDPAAAYELPSTRYNSTLYSDPIDAYPDDTNEVPLSQPTCAYCGTTADADQHCIGPATQEPEFYPNGPADVAREDGTYNPHTNRYCCTPCYIRIGMPSSPYGWTV